jgi:hypothetical protein
MKLKELEKTISDKIQENTKAQSERQERTFIDLINQAIKKNNNKPINVEFSNGYYIPDVTGAEKVEGKAPDGHEHYTDVVVNTKAYGNYNLSMKGPSAPTLAPGGERIESLYPRFLEKATESAIKKLQEVGYNDGDWWIDTSSALRSFARQVLKATFKKNSKIYNKNIVLMITENGVDQPYPLFSFEKEKDIPETNKSEEYDFGPEGLPPYFGGSGVYEMITKGDTVQIYADDLTDAKPYVKDIYIPLSPLCVENLLIGNEKMGGPVDYIYIGDMEPEPSFTTEGKTSTLLINNASLYSPQEASTSVWLRIRRRRADMPFSVSERSTNGDWYAVFGKGVYSGERSRIVVTDKLPAGAVELDSPIEWDCEAIEEAPPLKQNESLTKSKITYKMLEQMVEEAIKKAR